MAIAQPKWYETLGNELLAWLKGQRDIHVYVVVILMVASAIVGRIL